MSDTSFLPVAAEELLARFIIDENWIRSNQTVRHYAFMPPKELLLSVSRHGNLSEEEIWTVGQEVLDELAAKNPAVRLHGRADLFARDVSDQKLRTEAAPVPSNPNHAHIAGWPTQKPAQKSIAQELAARAVLRRP